MPHVFQGQLPIGKVEVNGKMEDEYITAEDRLWQRTERRCDSTDVDAVKKAGKTKEQKLHPSSIRIEKWKSASQFQYRAMMLSRGGLKSSTFNLFMRNIHFNTDQVNLAIIECMRHLKDPQKGIYQSMAPGKAPVKFVSSI